MAEWREIAVFTAPALAPVLPEACQVNPGVYGAETAFWLCTTLARRGVVTSYPEYEDWGWYLEYVTETGSEFALHCGNVDGSRTRWQLALRRYGRAWFGRDRPPYAEAAPLIEALRQALAEDPVVTDLDWRYDEAA